jgi:hypothetical protein
VRRPRGARRYVAWAAAVVLACAVGRASAATLVVDDDNVQCPTAQFHTVNAALVGAQPGDEITLCAGTYAEQIVMTTPHPIHGVPDGFTLPVIAPTSMPTFVSGSGNPVAAAIAVDGAVVRIENVVIDLRGVPGTACSPIVAGIYLRNVRGTLLNTTIRGAAVPGRADCDSGVGLIVDSGLINPGTLHEKIGRSAVAARFMTFDGNQRAALAAFGEKTVVRVIEALVAGSGRGMPFVQHGFQFADGARGKVQDVRLRDLGTSLAGKTAAGLLVYGGERVRTRRPTMERVQTGAFIFGNRNRVAGGVFTDVSSDGVVIIGDQNRVLKTDMTVASVDGVFLDGDQNLVRGGGFSDMPIGIWDYLGVGNRADQIEFIRVPERVRIGGVRSLPPESAMPFTLTCAAAVECDDGNPCTTDACTGTGDCESTILPDGTACAGGTCAGGLCM